MVSNMIVHGSKASRMVWLGAVLAAVSVTGIVVAGEQAEEGKVAFVASQGATPELPLPPGSLRLWTLDGYGRVNVLVAPTPTPTPGPVDPELFYYYDDDRIYLTPSEEKIGVCFKGGVTEEDVQAFLESYSELSNLLEAIYTDKPTRIRLSESTEWSDLEALIEILSTDARVAYVTPIFVDAAGRDSGALSDTFIVMFRPDVIEEEINAFNEAHDVSVVTSGLLPHRHGRWLLSLYDCSNALNVLYMANLYNQDDMTEYGTPNFWFYNVFYPF